MLGTVSDIPCIYVSAVTRRSGLREKSESCGGTADLTQRKVLARTGPAEGGMQEFASLHCLFPLGQQWETDREPVRSAQWLQLGLMFKTDVPADVSPECI